MNSRCSSGHDWSGLVCRRCGETREERYLEIEAEIERKFGFLAGLDLAPKKDFTPKKTSFWTRLVKFFKT